MNAPLLLSLFGYTGSMDSDERVYATAKYSGETNQQLMGGNEEAPHGRR
jgi:hypothetical protein